MLGADVGSGCGEQGGWVHIDMAGPSTSDERATGSRSNRIRCLPIIVASLASARARRGSKAPMRGYGNPDAPAMRFVVLARKPGLPVPPLRNLRS
eukprot:259824-Rhodomonas_salina.1